MSSTSTFDVYRQGFNAMSNQELLDALVLGVSSQPLGDDVRAFLDVFASRFVNETQQNQRHQELAQQATQHAQQATQHAQNADNNASQAQQQAYEAQVAADQLANQLQAVQAELQATKEQLSANQAAGLGTTSGQHPHVPQHGASHQSNTNSGVPKLDQALLKNIKPPTFDGSKVIDWSFRVIQYMETIDPQATDESKLKFAINLLTGRALTWWRHHVQTTATISTWSELRDSLYHEFVDINHIHKIRDLLDSLTLSQTKTVTKFATKFREYQLELGPHALDEGTAVHKFINGLHGPVRMYTSLQDPQTLEQAFKIAEKCESNSRNTNSHISTKQTNVRSDAMELGNAQAQHKGKHTFRRPNATNTDAWKTSAVCHHCGKKGHIKPDCRLLQRQQNTKPNGGSHNAKPKGGRAKLSLAEQVANIGKELAALKASKN